MHAYRLTIRIITYVDAWYYAIMPGMKHVDKRLRVICREYDLGVYP